MSVLDTSVVIDLLLGTGAADTVTQRLATEGGAVAPDILVFETLAVLRREVGRGTLTAARAEAAVDDLGDLAVDLVPSLPLRTRVWELRHNLTAADALFVATAEAIDEPLLTRDAPLAAAAADVSTATVEHLLA